MSLDPCIGILTSCIARGQGSCHLSVEARRAGLLQTRGTFNLSSLTSLTTHQPLGEVKAVESTTIEDLTLDFTLPGYDIELRVRVEFAKYPNTHICFSPTAKTLLSHQRMSMSTFRKFSTLSSERGLYLRPKPSEKASLKYSQFLTCSHSLQTNW